jgi:hypothetical protein
MEFGPERGKLLRCPLCSIRGGAMKPTVDSANIKESFRPISSAPIISIPVVEAENSEQTKEDLKLVYDFKQVFTEEELANEPVPKVPWVHLSCSFWLPELSFENDILREPIAGLESIDNKRYKLLCSICKRKGIGCCVQCAKGKCQTAFHVECARLAGYYMEGSMLSNEEIANIIYCEKHRPLQICKSIDDAQKHSVDEITTFCKILEKCKFKFEKLDNSQLTNSKKKLKTNKLFNKMEKKMLITRIRQICKKYGTLTLSLSQIKEENDVQKFKILQSSSKLTYFDTLNIQRFPWNDVKFDRFTAKNCFLKYINIIPDEISFKLNVLNWNKKRVEKLQVERQKAAKIPKIEVVAVDTKRYCYCQKLACELPGTCMIGNIDLVYFNRMLWRY